MAAAQALIPWLAYLALRAHLELGRATLLAGIALQENIRILLVRGKVY